VRTTLPVECERERDVIPQIKSCEDGTRRVYALAVSERFQRIGAPKREHAGTFFDRPRASRTLPRGRRGRRRSATSGTLASALRLAGRSGPPTRDASSPIGSLPYQPKKPCRTLPPRPRWSQAHAMSAALHRCADVPSALRRASSWLAAPRAYPVHRLEVDLAPDLLQEVSRHQGHRVEHGDLVGRAPRWVSIVAGLLHELTRALEACLAGAPPLTRTRSCSRIGARSAVYFSVADGRLQVCSLLVGHGRPGPGRAFLLLKDGWKVVGADPSPGVPTGS